MFDSFTNTLTQMQREPMHTLSIVNQHAAAYRLGHVAYTVRARSHTHANTRSPTRILLKQALTRTHMWKKL